MSVKKIGFKRGQLKEIVLEEIADYLIEAKSYPGPNLIVILGLLMKIILVKHHERISKKQVRRVLANLEKEELIHLEDQGDKAIVTIRTKGEPKILEYSLKKLLDMKTRKKNWRGKWYLVVFDVPESQRNKRDYLRKFLLKVGFYRYQQSVYLFPYECEEEITLIKKMVEGAKYASYVVAEKIENEEQAKRFFNL